MMRCIYCKELKPVPIKGEHVVQDSLGGTLRIKCVCSDCNGKFSSIDQFLAENSGVAFERLIKHPIESGRVRLGGLHFIDSNDEKEAFEIVMRGQFKGEIKPQLLFELVGDELKTALYGKDAHEIGNFISVIRKNVKNKIFGNIPIFNSPMDTDCYSLGRLVLHQKTKLYFRRSKNDKDDSTIHKAVGMLEKNGEKFLLEMEEKVKNTSIGVLVHQPKVSSKVSINLGAVNRAVAKVAFNLLAYAKGAEFVLDDRFDDVRRYIVGEKVHESLDDEKEEEQKFILEVPQDQDIFKLMPVKGNPDAHHALFTNLGPLLVCVISFYGSIQYVVGLGEGSYGPEIEIHEFDYRKGIYRTLSTMDVLKMVFPTIDSDCI
jgi:hypothetical protein